MRLLSNHNAQSAYANYYTKMIQFSFCLCQISTLFTFCCAFHKHFLQRWSQRHDTSYRLTQYHFFFNSCGFYMICSKFCDFIIEKKFINRFSKCCSSLQIIFIFPIRRAATFVIRGLIGCRKIKVFVETNVKYSGFKFLQ